MRSPLNIILRNGTVTPDRLPGLAAWYSADYGVLTQVGGATSFSSAGGQNLSLASGSNVKFDTSFTFCLWVYPTSTMPNYAGILFDQYEAYDPNNRWYLNSGPLGTTKVYAGVRLSGGPISTASTGQSSWTANTWNFLVFDYDDATKKCSLTVNNGTKILSPAGSGSIFGEDRQFIVGRTPGGIVMDGRIDEVAFWKRVLTVDERTWLYNSGSGRTYSEADAAMKTNLVSWWSMNAPASGNWIDQHGSNHLSPSASSPSATDGVTFRSAGEGETVRRWLDRSGNGRHLEQQTLVNQPTITGGKLVFNGSNSKMFASSISAGPWSQYLACVWTRNGGAWQYIIDGHTTDTASILSGVAAQNDTMWPKDTSIAMGTTGGTLVIAAGQMTVVSGVPIMIGGIVNGASSRIRIGSYSTTGNGGTGHPGGSASMGCDGSGASYAKVTVMESAMFSRALSVLEENSLAKYFQKRWGVAT